MADKSAEVQLKPIIAYWPSPTGHDAPSSRSSSTSAEDNSVSGTHHDSHLSHPSQSSSPRTLPSCLTVKFAPLPIIEPRRRKSNFQLGVAARSQMIQARRNGGLPPQDWRPVDEPPAQDPSTFPEDEDPLEVFGRYVVGKSKFLWRRMASKTSPKPAVVIGETYSEKLNAVVEHGGQADAANAQLRSQPQADEIGEFARFSEEDGSVVEEELGGHFQLRLQRSNSLVTGNDEKRTRRLGKLTRSSSQKRTL